MSLKRITNTSIESNRVVLRPSITYIRSGSDTTGSMPLVQNPSDSIRNVYTHFSLNGYRQTNTIENIISNIQSSMISGQDSTRVLRSLLSAAPEAPVPSRNNKEFNITIENVPGIQFYEANTNMPRSGSLSGIVNSLIEKESESNRELQYGFTNYNCLGFVSGGNESPRQCLIYNRETDNSERFGSFGVSFFIKPPNITTSQFNPGTIFHIDNLISISLVSGSSIDRFGNTNSFKIVSQIVDSNEINPSRFSYSANDLSRNRSVYSDFSKNVLFNESNELEKNTWYHILVSVSNENRQGSSTHKIFINGEAVASSLTSLTQSFVRNATNSYGTSNYQILIGNKIDQSIGGDYEDFFTDKFSAYDLYTDLNSNTADPSLDFESRFFGELHDIAFFTSELNTLPVSNILKNRNTTFDQSLYSNLNLDFYLPVLFCATTRQVMRSNLTIREGSDARKSMKPIAMSISPHENPFVSNDLRAVDVNISSFLAAFYYNKNTREIEREYPRCLGMEVNELINDDENYSNRDASTSHSIVSSLSSFFTRNNLIRPCDNSDFNHDYDLYEKMIDNTGNVKLFLSSSLGHFDASHVLMKNYINKNIVNSSFINFSTSGNYSKNASDPWFDKNTESDRTGPSWSPVLFSEKLYSHSNLVSIIDIPQMFYSKRIYPGTFEMIDYGILGSNGMLTYRIKDNGLGVLYRDDSISPNKRNKCGMIFYELGIVLLTHPSLALFGNNNHYEIKFKGEHDLNVLSLNAHMEKYEFNESVNPSYNKLGKIGDKSNDNSVVMITGIDYLDDNLNVVMRTNLSQPVSKREFDEILFKSRIDF